jgi:hypothetical protein
MIRKSVIFGTLVLFFSSCLGPFDPYNVLPGEKGNDPITDTEALVGHWNLNEGKGTQATNLVSNRNHGAISNCVWDSSGGLDSSAALRFDGITSFLMVPDDSSLNLGTGDFTISIWIKPDYFSGSGSRTIVRKGEEGKGFSIVLYRNRIIGLAGNKTTITSADTTLRIFDSTWHHVVFSRVNSIISLYLDNHLVHSYEYTGSVSSTSPLFIGRGRTESDYYSGLIDEIKILNYGWSESERISEYIRATGR